VTDSSLILYTASHQITKLICAGFGYSWPPIDCSGLWFVAIYGAPVRNRADVHPGRFLLLLCEEVNPLSVPQILECDPEHYLMVAFVVTQSGRWATGATAPIRGGVRTAAMF
jgi:hypothetical protein